MKHKVLIAFETFDEDRKIIESELSEVAEIIYVKNRRDVKREIEDCEVVICSWLSESEIATANKLRFVQTVMAGVDRFNFKLLREKGIMLSSGKGCNAIPVAEHAMALILALSKRIVEYDREMKEGRWVGYTFETMLDDLWGKTLVILGYGNIGRELARMAKSFGMKIIGIKRSEPSVPYDEYADLLVSFENIEKVLPEADFLVILTPLTQETKGMIDESKLKLLKRSAFLINLGRGSVIDERSLCKALKERWIRGAGLDVWWAYPPDPYTPSKLGIHLLENVVATPHKGGWTREARRRCIKFAVKNVRRFLMGETPLNIVDYNRGY